MKARPLWIAAATVVAALLTASLGLWQLSRASQKTALQESIERKGQLPPVQAEDFLRGGDIANLLHRRIWLKGHWLAQSTIYLENRQMDGRPGFLVLTPLLAEPGAVAVLVLRGWAPRNFQDRAALPTLRTPAGMIELSGQIVPPPSSLYDFGGVDAGPIRQNLDLASFSRELDRPLLALAVQQQSESGDGLLRRWPVASTGVEKHHGYAFQWFGLTALFLCLYVWFQIIQPRRRRRRPS